MAEYTYKDIITDPEDPRLEIGAEYFFGDDPYAVLIDARNSNLTGKLVTASESNGYRPFKVNLYNSCYSCLIRKKEPQYVPFDLSKEEVREKLRGRWVKSNKDSSLFEFQITQFSVVNILNHDIAVINTAVSAVYPEDLLKDYIFIDDNTPCGELIDITSDDGLSEGENDN